MSNPNIVWLKNGRILKQVEDSIQIVPALPKMVYNMCMDSQTHELYLEEFTDSFHFNFKVYGLESRLIEHIMATFNGTTSNLGILFNGVKGTGKTITAKILANRMGLPVILINAPYPGLAEFIAKISCPVVLFFDEFEKNFDTEKKQDLDLLSLMDGVFNSPHRRVFLLTTNKLFINENLIGRPSRIRYKKSFNNLSPEVIMEYLDDCLENKEYTQDILSFIDTLSISTIDILKSIVEELNIHKIPLAEFKHFLNVEQAKYSYLVKFCGYRDNEEGSAEIFRNTLKKVGTVELDEDGQPYTLDEDDLDIYTKRINLRTPIEAIRIGDDLGSWGTVTESLDEGGIFATEDSYGMKRYFKVMNLDSKPSLYRGGLAI